MQRNPLTAIHARTRPAPLFDTNLDNEDDIQRWEDGDSYPIPPTNMRDARDDYGGAPREYDDNAPAGNPQNEFDLGKPRTAAERYEAALNAKTSHESQMPRESDHKPKGWQRAIAAAANFGAGYVNAGGRVRVDPGAMQNINQSLLRPGYQRDVQKWKEQGVGINSEIDAAGRSVQMESQKQRAELEARRGAAYEKAQGAQESYNRRREAKLDEPVWHQSNTGHVIWRENEDGSIRKEQIEAPKTPPPVKETNAEAVTRRWEEVKDDPDLTPEQKKTYKLTGRVPAKPRPVGVGKGGGGKPRKGTPGQLSTLEKDITKEYAAAEAAALKELATAGLTGFNVNDPWKANDTASGEKIAGIERRLVNRKNQIEKSYNARGAALGGEVREGSDPAYSVSTPKSGGVVVMLPNGKTVTFADQATAEAYKRKVGL